MTVYATGTWCKQFVVDAVDADDAGDKARSLAHDDVFRGNTDGWDMT